MIIVCISDTHNRHRKITIPECDILIHSGDATSRGYKHEVEDFAKWFDKQPAKYKIFVPGNHELAMFNQLSQGSRNWFEENCPSGFMLINESITIEGLKIYGSPVTPFFHNWAWNEYPDELEENWEKIPDDTNILITHGPPFKILDTIDPLGNSENLGCFYLANRINELQDLDLHIFGHIHGCGGTSKLIDGTEFVNAAVCNEMYYPGNGIVVTTVSAPTEPPVE